MTTATLLGDPLARVQERISTRRQQTAVVPAVLGAAIVALATGHRGALALVPVCASAEIVLATSLLRLASDRRAQVLELIADGHGALAAVARERRRLLTAWHRAQLARSLHELADNASVRVACPASGRPLYSPLVRTALAAELHATALLISGDDVAIAGVALTERLLSGHDSPLYGADPNLLRQELHRINFALQSTAAETDACAHDAIACT